MIIYEALTGIYKPCILKHEVEERTGLFNCGEGKRYAINDKYSHFFTTWKDAHKFLVSEAQTAYTIAKDKFEAAAAELNKVVELVNLTF